MPELEELRVPIKVEYEVFSNNFLVVTGPYIFVLNFGQMLSEGQKFTARIFLDPLTAKSFHLALKGKVEEYEKQFGEIKGAEVVQIKKIRFE